MTYPQGKICENDTILPPGVEDKDVSASIPAGCFAPTYFNGSFEQNVHDVGRHEHGKLNVLVFVPKFWRYFALI